MSTTETSSRDSFAVDSVTVINASVQKSKGPSTLRRRAALPPLAAAFVWIFAVTTCLALWFLFNALVLTHLQEHGNQARLYAEFREELANATAPLGGSIKPGSPVALVDTPLEGMRGLVVVEGTAAEQLTFGPGHLRDTPLPGQAGVSVIFARSVTYGAPFRDLAHLMPGERITVTTAQGVFTYRVDRVRRSVTIRTPSVLANQSQLTLVTSESSGWRSGWAPDHAISLDATLVGRSAAPAPEGRVLSVDRSEQPMQSDAAALRAVVAWLLALLPTSAGLAWTWWRWGRWQTWIAGVPLVLALLWGASAAVLRLLPNLI